MFLLLFISFLTILLNLFLQPKIPNRTYTHFLRPNYLKLRPRLSKKLAKVSKPRILITEISQSVMQYNGPLLDIGSFILLNDKMRLPDDYPKDPVLGKNPHIWTQIWTHLNPLCSIAAWYITYKTVRDCYTFWRWFLHQN